MRTGKLLIDPVAITRTSNETMSVLLRVTVSMPIDRAQARTRRTLGRDFRILDKGTVQPLETDSSNIERIVAHRISR